MDWRYRAVPCGVTITDQPGMHWLSALRTLKIEKFFPGTADTERYPVV